MVAKTSSAYRDHSHVTDDDKDLNLLLDKADTEGVKGTDQTFPVKLHQLLSGTDEDGFSHIVSWQPHGRSFIVKKHNEFVEKVLPCCFRQTKFASFQRQLNLYGFRRITQGRDKGGYYHELFLRGRTLLALKMQRTKVKGTGARKASSPETEPDFYSMPFVYERDDKKNDAAAAVSPTATMPTAAASPVTGRPFASASSELLKVSPPAYSTAKPVIQPLARSGLAGLNSSASMLPPSRLSAGWQENAARREIMAQMMASSSRIQSLRETSQLSVALGSSYSPFLTPAQSGPLHLNALNMPCTCAIPAF